MRECTLLAVVCVTRLGSSHWLKGEDGTKQVGHGGIQNMGEGNALQPEWTTMQQGRHVKDAVVIAKKSCELATCVKSLRPSLGDGMKQRVGHSSGQLVIG